MTNAVVGQDFTELLSVPSGHACSSGMDATCARPECGHTRWGHYMIGDNGQRACGVHRGVCTCPEFLSTGGSS